MSTEAICSKCKMSSPFNGSQGNKTVELKFCYRCGGELIIKRDILTIFLILSISHIEQGCYAFGGTRNRIDRRSNISNLSGS